MTRATPGDPGLTILPPGRLVGVFVAVLLVVLAVLNALTQSHAGWGRFVYLAVLIVLACAAAIWQWRSYVRADRGGVTARVQLLRRTRPVSWAEVDHFALGGYWRGLGVLTVDGHWVHLMTYGLYERRAEGALAQLEHYRAAQAAALG